MCHHLYNIMHFSFFSVLIGLNLDFPIGMESRVHFGWAVKAPTQYVIKTHMVTIFLHKFMEGNL